MLEHLISDDLDPTIFDGPPIGFTALDKAAPEQLIDAQAETAQWLNELGLTDTKVDDQEAASTARNAFAALTNGTTPANIQTALTSMKTPVAVQRLVGMLTAYDWEFVQQAKEIRGYTVAKLIEETESPNANIRLKALGLLGKVTEVGLFTEKVEIKKTDLTEEEIDKKLKEKLAKFMGVTDADYTDVEDKLLTDDDEPATDA
jgi:hypothetical protein